MSDHVGFGSTSSPEPVAEPESYVYVPVLHSAEPSWRTRIGGLVGLMLLITAAALTAAVTIYQLGYLVSHMIQAYMTQ